MRIDRSLATANSDASRELGGKVIKAIRTKLTFPARKLEITFKTDSHEVNVMLISAQSTVHQTNMFSAGSLTLRPCGSGFIHSGRAKQNRLNHIVDANRVCFCSLQIQQKPLGLLDVSERALWKVSVCVCT